jgi:Flp pilus assembly protein TadB
VADLPGDQLVSRREYEQAISHLRELMANAHEAQQLRAESLDKARELQADEYERRLKALNHEAARLLAAAEKAVLSDVFEPWQKQVNDFITERRTVTDTSQQGAAVDARTLSLVIGGVGVIIAIVAVIVAVWGG